MNPVIPDPQADQLQWLASLCDWEAEMMTNEHGLQSIAWQAIRLARNEIHYRWPQMTLNDEKVLRESLPAPTIGQRRSP